MGQVTLGLPADLRKQDQRKRRQARALPGQSTMPADKIGAGVGGEQQQILQQAERGGPLAQQLEEGNLQPCVERWIRAVSELKALSQDQLFRLIQFETAATENPQQPLGKKIAGDQQPR